MATATADVVVEAKLGCVAANPREGRAYTLLHDRTELACEYQLTSSTHPTGFYKEQLATRRRPSEAEGDPRTT
jgi:hypothetical protein